MRLFLHDYAGHPFQAQLSRRLAGRGHEVIHAFAGSLQTPRGELKNRADDPATLRFRPIDLGEPIAKYSFYQRWRQERAYGRLLRATVADERPDVVMSANTPSECQAALARQCQSMGVPLVSWVQDIYGVAAHRILRKKLPVIGDLIGRQYMRMDRRSARASAAVVLITEDFKDQMRQWGVPDERMTVIPNWAVLDDLPVGDKDNPWSRSHNLHDKRVLLYSGTLAMKHNPALLLELARRFRADDSVRLVVISEGKGVQWLREQCDAEGLKNLVVMKFQDFKQMPNVLAAGDVLLAILEPDAGTFSVPSKILSYLCAKRPLLLAMPLENLGARMVTQMAGGIAVSPADAKGFADGAGRLLGDESLRRQFGQNARAYAEAEFDIEKIADRFESLLSRLTPQTSASMASTAQRLTPQPSSSTTRGIAPRSVVATLDAVVTRDEPIAQLINGRSDASNPE
jgi:glycosyltransferase involved in cell wall biosynthesis